MKLRHIGQAALAGAVSLGTVFGIGACGRDNTIDYVYITNSKNATGQINVYLVDHLSGTLNPIRESPYPSLGRNPIDIASTPNGKYLYVANHDDSTIVAFGVGTDAKIYSLHTYQTQDSNASFPTSLRVNSAGTFLYVTNAFQSQYSPSTPGPGALLVYPINADGSLGTPVADTADGTPYFPTCNNPVAVNVLNNDLAVYVVDDPASQPPKLADTTSSSNVGANGTSTIQYTATAKCSATGGQISAYSVGTGSVLTEIQGSPFKAGSSPDAIVSDPQDRFLYVTDLTQNQLLAYVATGIGALTPINNGPFTTGVFPNAVTIDPTAKYLYVANYGGGGTVSAYQITSTGVPSAVATGTYAVKTGPTAVYIEPSSGRYLYTANFVDNTVSGLNLNPDTGALNAVQNSPFPANGQPTAITAVTHGSHAIEVLPQY